MRDTHTLRIPVHHPAFEGHFPGTPVLPGVVLLDELLQVLLRAGAADGGSPIAGTDSPALEWTIATAKFLHPVRPGETLTFEHERLANGSVRFTIRSAERPVANGMLVPKAATAEPDHGNQAR